MICPHQPWLKRVNESSRNAAVAASGAAKSISGFVKAMKELRRKHPEAFVKADRERRYRARYRRRGIAQARQARGKR